MLDMYTQSDRPEAKPQHCQVALVGSVQGLGAFSPCEKSCVNL